MGSRPESQLTTDAFLIIERHPIAFAAMTTWSLFFLALTPVRTPLKHVLGLQQKFIVQEPGSIRLRDALAHISTDPRNALGAIFRNEFDGSFAIAGLVIIQVLLSIVLWLGVFAGLTAASTSSYRGKCILIILGAAFLLLLLASGPEATARMRIPALPFLAIVAGIGLERIAVGLGSSRRMISTSVRIGDEATTAVGPR
jgi:hypothetical protein